jgi:Protein of unknown function (DUF3102)
MTHVCAQCGGQPVGKEEPLRHGDAVIWLHPECKRFWFRDGPRQPEPEAQQTKQIARPLHVLVPLLKDEIRQAEEAARRAAMPHYVAVGKMLIEAKAQLEHGKFMLWVDRNLNVTHRRATEYMALARHESGSDHFQFETLTKFIRETRNPNYNKPFAPTPIDIDGMREREEERRAESRLCLEIISTGYKTLAAKMHPDKGGSAEAMTRLNRARDHLKNYA